MATIPNPIEGQPQAGQSPVQVQDKTEALSARTQGANPRMVTIDWRDLQEEFEILPEEGSTLSDDDQYRTGRLLQALQLALQFPQIFNVRAFAAAYLKSVPGISPEEGLAPPQPPPSPQPRISFSITAKFEDLAADVQAAILHEAGLPIEGTGAMSTIKHVADAVQHVGRAAESAAQLEQPSVPSADNAKTPTPPGMKGITGG